VDTSCLVCPSAENKIEYNLIKKWLALCDEQHRAETPWQLSCVSRNIALVSGMQVIDCCENVIVPYTSKNEDYIALSYVWGASNAQEWKPNSEAGFLPKLIEDAMVVVRMLGFRYLWVDRYCIPQNDEQLRQVQIQQMGKIYTESALTIIVVAGNDPDYGILGVSSTLRTSRPSILIDDHCLVGIRPPANEIRKSKWSTRGWTYQKA
jgi:hypothetical protein